RRQSYSLQFKRKLLDEAAQTSNGKVSKKYSVSESMLRKWQRTLDSEKARNVKPTNQQSTLRLGGGGRPTILTAAQEHEIYEWVLHARDLNLIVMKSSIQGVALNIARRDGVDPSFKATEHWVDGFMVRHKLSLRRASTLFKLTDDKIVEKAVNYKLYIEQLRRIRDGDFWCHDCHVFDETAVYAGQMSNTTIDRKGRSCVGIPANGYESERVTVMLHFDLGGRKGKPIIIAEDTTMEPGQCCWEDRPDDNVTILYTHKAWANQQACRRIINHVVPLAGRGKRRGLVIWDAAASHRAKAVKNYVLRRRCSVVMIPSGMTWLLQGLDTVINRPFKVYLRKCINRYFANNPPRNHRGNIKKPSLDLIIEWVTRAWAKITNAHIEEAVKHYYLHPHHGWADTKAAKHEKFGDLI
ncbi:unnamed protein product, partial [Heterosigma akashiwo]